jgi:hypothetical protein
LELNLMHKKRSFFCRLGEKKGPAAVALGRKGGRKIAKRGSEYFRRLQAKRGNRKGGRPPKSKKSS